MPIVTFSPSMESIEIEAGQTVYEAADKSGRPLASSCSGNFVCGKCNVQVLEGAAHCSEPKASEKDLLEREGHSALDRIGCQTRVYGDCVVTTRYW